MQIYVRCCDGKILSLDVDPQDTIESVKEQIQECQGIPPDEQRLLYQGKLLPEEGKSTLSDHWVGKEESFHLFGPGEPTEKQKEDDESVFSSALALSIMSQRNHGDSLYRTTMDANASLLGSGDLGTFSGQPRAGSNGTGGKNQPARPSTPPEDKWQVLRLYSRRIQAH